MTVPRSGPVDRAHGFGLAPGRIALLRAHAPDAARIVDEMPPNFLYLGFIATILAGTRIIHCRRHPLDTCLWLFFPYFRAGHPYAYSLERLGFYCREYRRRMAHWRAVPPKAMLELDYGALVDDRERESRRLIEFCGLPWGPRCRAFHETERAARTAEPVAGATAGLPPLGGPRWRRYQAHLQPPKDALGPLDKDPRGPLEMTEGTRPGGGDRSGPGPAGTGFFRNHHGHVLENCA